MSRPLLLVPVLLMGMAVAGCGGDDAATTGSSAGGGDGGGGGGDLVLTVHVGDRVVEWTLEDLEARTPYVEETIDGNDQRGPRLLDVLAASGVEAWETAEVFGQGEGRTFEVSIEIAAADVTDGWILDVTNRGTLKLAAENLPRELWVRDVDEIRIP